MEKISDITREMRKANFQPPGYQEYVNRYLDRIEEAHKREVVTNRNALNTKSPENVNSEKVIYNTAKLREAVEKIKECYENDYLSLDRDPGDVLGNAALLAESALAAPPRNCDLPTVIADPHGAWLKDRDNWDEFGSPEKEIYDWLLAEAKGETE